MLGKSDKYYANHLSEDEIGKVSVFVGAFMFVERQKYLKLNGFDEDFFMYGEDIDLSYRFLKQGFDNYYFGQTTIIHYKGESTNKDKIYLKRFYGAMKIFYKKHFRKNIFLNLMIDLGIKIFLLINNFKEEKTDKILPETYILISEDKDFRRLLSQKLLKDIDLIKEHKKLNFNLLKEDNIEIVFDNSYISNKEIIEFIQEHKGQSFTYKIKPRNTNFIIGSNHKNDKGE